MAKKKIARRPKAKRFQHKPVRTYRVTLTSREPEVVQCHSLAVYSDCLEFSRFVDTVPDDDGDRGEWITFLAIPIRVVQRVELVDDDAPPQS